MVYVYVSYVCMSHAVCVVQLSSSAVQEQACPLALASLHPLAGCSGHGGMALDDEGIEGDAVGIDW